MIKIVPNWHPLIVHFTIALLLTAAALFVLSTLFRSRPLGEAMTLVARWNLALGVLATVVTLATGWQAYNTVAHDEPSHVNMTIHLRWAIGTALMFLLAAGAAWLDRWRLAGAGAALMALLVVGAGALGVTGWLGGENVYRYGLGVLSLPKTGSHVHPGSEAAPHEHGSSAPASGSMSGMPGMGSGSDKAASPSAPAPVAPAAGAQASGPAAAHKH